MNFRKAQESDIPKIVELLKLSLGEGLMPKSEKFWRWKHLENPFGASPVLLCEENDQLIGLRAFLNWQWQHNGQILKAVRAVDTATHPDFQGKGIFSKLTKALLEECLETKIDFVFNTPNDKSKPGYLKMGWKEFGRIPLAIYPGNPLSKYLGKTEALDCNWAELMMKNDFWISIPSVNAENKCHTPLTKNYINWRYAHNPQFKYGFISNFVDFILIYRVKKHAFGNELRVTDFFGNQNSKEFNKMISNLKNNIKPIFVSCSGQSNLSISKLGAKIDKGPIMTLKTVNMDIEPMLQKNFWAFSLGDLELF